MGLGPCLGLRLLCLSLAVPGPKGWPGYASGPGPGLGAVPGPGPGPVLALLTVAFAWTRWRILGGLWAWLGYSGGEGRPGLEFHLWKLNLLAI